MILKEFHVWILMVSLLPKVLKETPPIHTLEMFGFHTNLIQAKWCETSPVQLRIFHRDAGVGLVTDTLGITKNAEDAST